MRHADAKLVRLGPGLARPWKPPPEPVGGLPATVLALGLLAAAPAILFLPVLAAGAVAAVVAGADLSWLTHLLLWPGLLVPLLSSPVTLLLALGWLAAAEGRRGGSWVAAGAGFALVGIGSCAWGWWWAGTHIWPT